MFVDRLLATLVNLRHGATYCVLACWFGVDCSTMSRAAGEMRPLPVERGMHRWPRLRLHAMAEVVGTGMTGIIDGTEIWVRRPKVASQDRDAFISGMSWQNAVKVVVVADEDGRVLFCSPTVPGSCAEITHARRLRLVGLLASGPAVHIGCEGLGGEIGGRFATPPARKFKKDAPDRHEPIHQRQRTAHSSRHIRSSTAPPN